MKLLEGNCPHCGSKIRYTERANGKTAWLPCCETNVKYLDGKLLSMGTKAKDWCRRQGGEMRLG